jgi:hypothetical protein
VSFLDKSAIVELWHAFLEFYLHGSFFLLYTELMVIDSVTAISSNLQSYTCNALVSKCKLSHTYLNIQPANKTHAHDLFFLEHAEELSIISLRRKKNVQGRERKLPQPNIPSSAEHNQTHGMTHERQIILGLPPHKKR